MITVRKICKILFSYQITQLSTIQSNTKGKTMLHFLVDYVAKERDGLCQNMDGFTDMLGSMHDASKGKKLHKALLLLLNLYKETIILVNYKEA